jgi:hypothetical protein
VIKRVYAVCTYNDNNIEIKTDKPTAQTKLIKDYVDYQLTSDSPKDAQTILQNINCVFRQNYIPDYGEIKAVHIEEDE